MKLINPNIKSRRLIYLKLICLFIDIDSGKKYGFNKRFSIFCTQFKVNFNSQLKGYINIRNGIKSAAPYVDLALQLRVIDSKEDKFVKNNQISFFQLNYDSLDNFELKQLMHLVLENDGWGMLLTVLSLKNKCQNYKEVKSNFEMLILNLISEIPQEHYLSSSLNEISSKFLNKISLDSFLLPRINWLFDFELVDLDYRVLKNEQIVELLIFPSTSCMSIVNELMKKKGSIHYFDNSELTGIFNSVLSSDGRSF